MGSNLTEQQVISLGKLAHSNPAGWAAFMDLLGKRHGKMIESLEQSEDMLQIHRAQGELRLIRSLKDDVQSAVQYIKEHS